MSVRPRKVLTYRCLLCGATFASASEMKKHYQEVHYRSGGE